MTETPDPSVVRVTASLTPSTNPFDFNKTAVFTALEAADITQITVTFDGYGDSGQIEGISASIGERPAPMPDCMIETLSTTWPQTEPALSSINLTTAAENLAYDVLAQTHCGWENNEGAYGDIIFDTAARTITLDYNERFTSSENFIHVL